jgi:hypothetical protein
MDAWEISPEFWRRSLFTGDQPGQADVKSEKLSIKTKMTLYKALIRSKMTYACPAWESAADSHLMKLQRLQNKVLRVTGGLPRRTPTRYMYAELQTPYVYDFITEICRKQANVIQNHNNENVRSIGNGVVRHRKHKRLKLSGGQMYKRSNV